MTTFEQDKQMILDKAVKFACGVDMIERLKICKDYAELANVSDHFHGGGAEQLRPFVQQFMLAAPRTESQGNPTKYTYFELNGSQRIFADCCNLSEGIGHLQEAVKGNKTACLLEWETPNKAKTIGNVSPDSQFIALSPEIVQSPS